MAYFAVSCQLDNSKEYPALWQAFTQLGALRAMSDLYLVDLDGAAADRLCAYLCQFIDEEDFLFVVPFHTRPSKQRCYRGTEAWLDERFPTNRTP
jgi:hypothetical protein